MIFLISNDHRRSLESTGVLHVTPDCLALSKGDRRGWEATPSEIIGAYTLCAKCAPSMTGGYPLKDAEI